MNLLGQYTRSTTSDWFEAGLFSTGTDPHVGWGGWRSPGETAVLFDTTDPFHPFHQAWIFSEPDVWIGEVRHCGINFVCDPPPVPHTALADLLGHDLVGRTVQKLTISSTATDYTARFFGIVPEPSSLLLAAVMAVAILMRRWR